MISIVMAYYNRYEQLYKTLDSIKQQSLELKDFEIIIVDDYSTIPLRDIFLNSWGMNIRILTPLIPKIWCNPCIPFNIGFKEVRGDKIIIQNPECFHNGRILSYVDRNLTDSNYLSFACYSLSEVNKIENFIPRDKGVVFDGDDGWYNHHRYRPTYYHFCSAITAKNLRELGGFDERFATGVGFDDDEFLMRIRRKGLTTKLIDSPYVLHQWHYSTHSFNGKSNRDLYLEVTKEKEWRANG